MTLPGVTEQWLAMHFVFTSKKTPIQISDILQEAEHMFKSVVYFEYMIKKKHFWEVESLNRMIVGPGEGGLTAIIRSREWVTSWLPYR
jgi:hypothetical protein